MNVAFGARAWYALVAPILLWAVHIVGEAALIPLACEHGSLHWLLHGLTAATAVATAGAMAVSWTFVRTGRDDEAAGTVIGRTRFLGMLGLVIGAANLALILLEGSYVLFIKPCA